MHEHGREERNVEEHSHQDEQGEAETDIEAVWEADTQDAVLIGVDEALELAEQLTRHSSGVGDDEESVSVYSNYTFLINSTFSLFLT